MIFFDLDDTLLDHEAAARVGAASVYKTFRDFFEGESLEDFLVRWHTVSEKYFQSNSPQYSLLEQRRRRIREIFPVPQSDQEADKRFQVYLRTYELNWHLFPDALTCLKALKGDDIGLITNGEGPQQRSKIEVLGLGPYLSTLIISREVDCAKPAKAIFELAAKRARVPLVNCFYIGDRLQTDAQGSQQAGMKGIWLDRKQTGQEWGGPVIHGLDELPSLLEKLKGKADPL